MVFCIFSYSMDFSKFSNPSQNVEFDIHRSHRDDKI